MIYLVAALWMLGGIVMFRMAEGESEYTWRIWVAVILWPIAIVASLAFVAGYTALRWIRRPHA